MESMMDVRRKDNRKHNTVVEGGVIKDLRTQNYGTCLMPTNSKRLTDQHARSTKRQKPCLAIGLASS